MTEKKFQHVISLGHACAVAHEMERHGYRDHSGPFDWCGSRSLKLKMQLLEEEFKPFIAGLRVDNLYQRDIPNIYLMKEYQIYFVHDFNDVDDLGSQLPSVIQKYKRRICQFYKDIVEPCLFIYYLYDQDDADWIDCNYDYILRFFKQFNEANEIVYITPSGVNFKQKTFFVENDEGADHAYDFTQKSKELLEFMTNIPYPSDKKHKNLEFVGSKPKKTRLQFFVDRISRFLTPKKPKYRHFLQSTEP